MENNVLVRVWRNQNLTHCWWECKIVKPPWKTTLQFSKMLNRKFSCDPGIPFLDVHSKGMKVYVRKYLYVNMHSRFILDKQKVETLKYPSTDEWKNKIHVFV